MGLLPSTNDRLLLRFVRTGDARALAKLFDRTAPELLRVAGWLSGNRADAEDLLQRTFVTVIEARNNYDPARRAMPWLVGILGNHGKKLKEQRSRRLEARPTAAEPDPIATASDAEFQAAVARLRAELGSPYAEVLDLHFEQELNAKQIAERLGRPAGTVRTQLVRGLELLRKRLPHGFVAGLLLVSTSKAASVNAVRAAILQHAGAVAGPVGAGIAWGTTGGVLMTKKLAIAIPVLLLMIGGGTWAALQANGEAAGKPAAPLAEHAVLANAPIVEPIATASPPTAIRESAVAPTADDVRPEPGFAALIVRLKWQNDGSPAAHIGVRAMPRPGTYVEECDGLTDAHGEVVLRRIRAGSCWVVSSFTSVQQLELAVGETRVIEATAVRKNHVRGRVVDVDDQPVADARIWVSDEGSCRQGFEVTRSDANGAFEVDLASDNHVGARKAGYAPSLLQTRQQGDAQELVLRLLGRGGSVRGFVRDAAGHAIANAVVDIGMRGGWAVGGSSNEPLTRPIPQRTATAADGSFVVEGVETGSTNVTAWAAGFALVTQRTLVEPDRMSDVEITLPRGAIVQGIVVDATGTVIAGATIGLVADPGVKDLEVESDAEGRFAMHDLPVGPCTLMARLRDAKAMTNLELVAGQTTTWQPVLAVGRHLRGRVVGPDGNGLPGLHVGTAAPAYPMARQMASTAANGAFDLSNLEDGPLDVLVSNDLTMLLRQPLLDRSKDSDLILTIGEADMPTAIISGRVVARDGKPIQAQICMLAQKFGYGEPMPTEPDGTFRSIPLPAGDYDLFVEAKGHGEVKLATLTLQPHEHHIVPDVVLLAEGRADIRLQADEVPQSCLLKLLREDGVCTALVTAVGKFATIQLQPGIYTALAQLTDRVGAVTFVVRSGETTAVNLFFGAAVKANIVCRGHGSLTKEDHILVIVRDAANTLVDSSEFAFQSSSDLDAVQLGLTLPPGNYDVELRISGGRQLAAKLTVRGAAEQAPLIVDLPPR